jgi:uncharacterized RDD family membrane protein YckC
MTIATEHTAPLYGRVGRRMHAFIIDWMIMVALMVVVLIIAVNAGSDRIGRILGFSLLALWLLYEPVLVWLTGSTVGHYMTNLRVVDDRTGGNVGFGKAVARLVIKEVFGIYSFVTMATTRRHQALHDLLTRSTVQVRDRSKLIVAHFVAANEDLAHPGMPPVWRRLAVSLGYVALSFLIYVPASMLLMSHDCLAARFCTQTEQVHGQMLALLWFAVCAVLLVLGWRGKLYGCRRRRMTVPA